MTCDRAHDVTSGQATAASPPSYRVGMFLTSHLRTGRRAGAVIIYVRISVHIGHTFWVSDGALARPRHAYRGKRRGSFRNAHGARLRRAGNKEYKDDQGKSSIETLQIQFRRLLI